MDKPLTSAILRFAFLQVAARIQKEAPERQRRMEDKGGNEEEAVFAAAG